MKILLPEREGYVCGDYLTIQRYQYRRWQLFLSLGEDELSSLTELLGGGGGSALTPDGNLTLIDDYGSTTAPASSLSHWKQKPGMSFT